MRAGSNVEYLIGFALQSLWYGNWVVGHLVDVFLKYGEQRFDVGMESQIESLV